jgi:predicted O-methyltransferase YrrM
MITKYFEERTGLRTVPEVSDNTKSYSMYDDGGVEVEVGVLLFGLVRILKPSRVLTTGVYSGISDMYIAQGLKDNGFGKTTAIEFEQYHIDRALNLWEKAGVKDHIEVHKTSSLDFKPKEMYQFMFLDTEPQIRFAELEKFYPFLDDGGYVGIHDLPRTLCQGNINPDHPEMKSYPFGDVPPLMKELLQTGKLIKIHFPSPRGLVFFYKPKEDDYKI